MDFTREEADRVLRERFGHEAFRPGQAAIVAAAAAGRDLLVVLRTGGGKSLCYQLPALLSSSPTLVVSPLISLMEDQVASLRRRGAPAVALTSVSPAGDRRRASEILRRSVPGLVYVSPERLVSASFLELVRRGRLSRLVVDEAHCISEWGHDFRPDYLRIGAFARRIGRPAVSAFTATATPRTREEIERRLGLRDPLRFVATSDRPNLRWAVRRARTDAAGMRQIARAIGERGDGAAIVYLGTRARAASCAAALRRLGESALAYHAGLTSERRSSAQRWFLDRRRAVVCATNAFGMGIDHPHVRIVAHLGMPGALEAYVQEAGRAGRDGHVARCLLVRLVGDRRRLRRRIAGLPRPARRRARIRLAAMVAYARTSHCRRRAIAEYFGEPPPPCAGCDRCDSRFRRGPSRVRATPGGRRASI